MAGEQREAPPQKVHITTSSINHGNSGEYSAHTEEDHNQVRGQHEASSFRYKAEQQVSTNKNDGHRVNSSYASAKISQEPPPPPPPLPKSNYDVWTEHRDQKGVPYYFNSITKTSTWEATSSHSTSFGVNEDVCMGSVPAHQQPCELPLFHKQRSREASIPRAVHLHVPGHDDDLQRRYNQHNFSHRDQDVFVDRERVFDRERPLDREHLHREVSSQRDREREDRIDAQRQLSELNGQVQRQHLEQQLRDRVERENLQRQLSECHAQAQRQNLERELRDRIERENLQRQGHDQRDRECRVQPHHRHEHQMIHRDSQGIFDWHDISQDRLHAQM